MTDNDIHGREGLTRRSFLKAAGFSVGAVALVGCGREPIESVLAPTAGREDLVPGRASWYATLCAGCEAGCGALAKVLDGRPIKMEGNPEHPVSRGGLCATGQALLLSLYDSHRLSAPRIGGKAATWDELDRVVLESLAKIRKERGSVRFLTRTVTSPTLRAEIAEFLAGFADAQHVEADVLSASATATAYERATGARVVPRYRLDRARVIVSFDADFLGSWVSPVEHSAGWAAARDLSTPEKAFAHHVQLEARYSITGAKADRRIRLAPGETLPVLARLASLVAAGAGGGAPPGPPSAVPVEPRDLEEIAARLLAAPRGRALVLAGANDPEIQAVVARLNHALGADEPGGTVDLRRPSLARRGNDEELARLVREIRAGEVAALFVAGANPVYDLPDGEELAAAVAKIPLAVSFADHLDETAAAVGYLAPDHHPLESWSDAEAVSGVVTIGQPVVRPVSGTRSILASLAAFSGAPREEREIFRDSWRARVWPRRESDESFEAFLDRVVERGFAEVKPEPVPLRPFDAGALPRAAKVASPAGGTLALVTYASIAMGDGRHAENAWLQELPDPVAGVVWDNFVSLSPAAAAARSVETGDLVRIAAAGEGGPSLELPVVVTPGQHDLVAAVALGYGRRGTERFTTVGPDWIEARPTVAPGETVGKNVAPFRFFSGGTLRSEGRNVVVRRTGRRHDLARTQLYDSLDVPEALTPPAGGHRDVVRELPLAACRAGKTVREPGEEREPDLWGRAPRTGRPQWGMTVDLAACSGCSACVIACQAENNVPVVGKDEVRRNREMHWIRLDRYFVRRGEDVDLVHQPMMCQQCGNAPCESVCPVLATVHSADGLNQQVYNRCVGTRYCANNCPYKVRRFNWFQYDRGDDTERLVLNPDVTVRDRGVMEKCSFCVQRIRDAKARARLEGRPLAGSDVVPACAQSCPSRAITFGDREAKDSELARRHAEPRRYEVLAELNVKPVVSYLAIVRDREESHD